MTDLTLALDVGGTKIAVGLVDPSGVLVFEVESPTPRTDAEAVWAVVAELVSSAMAVGGDAVRRVGIASAGPVDVGAGVVSPINLTVWQRFPLVARMSELTGLPVRLGGDGLCMAMGERLCGAARDAEFLLGIVVSTGVGGGLVLDGAPYDGRTGNAGHVGHVVVDVSGDVCSCGGHGCVETVAAGPHLVRWAVAHGWVGSDARELAAAARAGDAVALEAYARGARALAAMIASVAAVCDLDRVVIGGGVSRAGPLLFDGVREALSSYAGLSFLRELTVVPAALSGSAGLVGAAALAIAD